MMAVWRRWNACTDPDAAKVYFAASQSTKLVPGVQAHGPKYAGGEYGQLIPHWSTRPSPSVSRVATLAIAIMSSHVQSPFTVCHGSGWPIWRAILLLK